MVKEKTYFSKVREKSVIFVFSQDFLRILSDKKNFEFLY